MSTVVLMLSWPSIRETTIISTPFDRSFEAKKCLKDGGKRISVARINALIPTEDRIRSLLSSVEGDFQSYMSIQADNISLAFDNLKESAAPGSKPGVDGYMKVYNTDHLKYCRDE